MDISPLGQKTIYKDKYSKSLLFPVPRKIKRQELGIKEQLPFFGYDIWNAYEISWLNKQYKPEVRIAEIIFPVDTKNIVESKSLKLYLNSFNSSNFDSEEQVVNLIINDLSELIEGQVKVKFLPLDYNFHIHKPQGKCIDNLDVEISKNKQEIKKELLLTKEEYTEESIYSNLLKSNCPVTSQPDWATIFITYEGKKLCHESLLRYLISYRNCNEFHEQCVERIFLDIQKISSPTMLTVYARYTRRGGIDINPLRSSKKLDFSHISNVRLARQ